MKSLFTSKIIGLILLSLFCSSCIWSQDKPSHLQIAEELSRQGQYQQAIAEYEKHMHERLSRKDRPEWENPYFYLVLIGDLELKGGDPEKAMSRYNLADEKGVDENLVSDRYRSVAHWYEEQGRLEEAVTILSKRRDKDPLLFDSVLDRLSKEIVKKEDDEKRKLKH